jgi:DNA-binding transcriptional ArsR family regulator
MTSRKIHTIRSTGQLRALVSHPMRSEIVELVALEALAISQIAQAVKEQPNRVYYHVSELTKAGLLRVAGSARKGNLIERRYQSVAPWIRVDERLFERGRQGRGLFARTIEHVLDAASADLGRLDEAGPLDAAMLEHVLRTFNLLRLGPKDVAVLGRKLKALVTEFKRKERPGAAPTAALTIVYYPRGSRR